jgi:hypothetical protein
MDDHAILSLHEIYFQRNARSVVVSVAGMRATHHGSIPIDRFSPNNIYRYNLFRVELQRDCDVPVAYGVFDNFGDLSEDAIF